jgi:hypothetical protein
MAMEKWSLQHKTVWHAFEQVVCQLNRDSKIILTHLYYSIIDHVAGFLPLYPGNSQ